MSAPTENWRWPTGQASARGVHWHGDLCAAEVDQLRKDRDELVAKLEWWHDRFPPRWWIEMLAKEVPKEVIDTSLLLARIKEGR